MKLKPLAPAMRKTGLMLAAASLLAVCLTIAPCQASAQDAEALDFSSLGSGSDYHQGAYCLGWRFKANQDCVVSELGFYDSKKDGLTYSHLVGIFDVVTKELVASATVSPGDPLTGFFRYQAITPVQLTAGRDYYAVADVGSESYAIDVSNLIIDPAITYVGFTCNYGTAPSSTLDYPTSDAPGVHGDFGPSFKLRSVSGVTPTPTPGPSPTPTPTPTPTPNPSPTPTPPPNTPTPPPGVGDLSVVIISPPVDAPIAAGSTLPIAVAVSDGPSYTVTEVNYFVDGAYVATTGASGPFFISITAPAAGSHLLQASARDSGGRSAAASYRLTTYAAGSPPPNVASVSGLDDRNVNAGETIMAVQSVTASPGSSINSVTFYADSTAYPGEAADTRSHLAVTQKDAPASFGAGARLYRALIPILAKAIGSDLHVFALATDSAGVSQVSAVETLHVKDPAEDPSAMVTLGLGSVANVTIGKPLQLAAKITDASGAAPATPIVRLEYLVNGETVQDSADPSAGFSFAPTSADDFLLSAIATDAKGLSSFSDPVLATAAAAPVITVALKGQGLAVEGGAPAKVIMTRTGDPSAELKVAYKVTSGSGAVNGIDYARLSGKVVFPAGKASVKLKTRALNDSVSHGPRKLTIKLIPSPDGSYTLGDAFKAKVQLIDND